MNTIRTRARKKADEGRRIENHVRPLLHIATTIHIFCKSNLTLSRPEISLKLCLCILSVSFLLATNASAATVTNRVTGAANWNTAATWIQNRTGTMTFTNGSRNVTGSGTLFTTELAVGNVLILQTTPGTIRGTISSIQSNTQLTLVANASATISGAYGRQQVPGSSDDVVIGNTNLTSAAVTVTLDTSATVNSVTFTAMALANTLTHSGTNSLTVSNSVTVNQPTAAVTIAWNVNGGTATVGGNLAIGGTNTTASRVSQLAVTSGSLTVNGTASYASNSVDANEVITVSTGTITFTSNLTFSSGTLSITSTGTIDFNGNFTYGGVNTPVFNTVAGSSIIFEASYTGTTALLLNGASNSIFSGNSTITANSPNYIAFGNVQLNSGSAVTLTSGGIFYIAGNWTNNGGTLSAAAATALQFFGSGKTIGGTSSTTFSVIEIYNQSATNSSYTMNNSNSATGLLFDGGTVATSLTLGSASVVLTINGTVTLNQPTASVTEAWNINAGTATVSGLITFAGANATTTLVSKIAITTGTLNANGGITFTGSAAATKVVDMSGGAGTLNLKGALTVPAASSTLTAGTSGSIFNYADTSAQTVNFFSAGAYHNLHTNNTNANGATLSAAITTANVTGNLRVQSGTLNNGGFAIAGNAGKVFEVASGAIFRIAGTTSAFPTGFGTVTLGATSTVDYTGTGAQTVAAQNYGNLTSSSSGTRTLAGSGTVGIAGTFTPGSNSYTITGSTIDFNGTGSQTIPSFNYNNLTSSSTGPRTLASGTIGIAGIFSPGTNAYTITGSTIDFKGAGAQTVPAFNYNNLTISASRGGASVTLANSGTIGVAGALTDTATFNPGSGFNTAGSTVDYNGAGSQSVTALSPLVAGNSTYNNLTISNTAAPISAATSFSVGGTFSVSPNAVFSPSAAAVISGAGMLNGSGTVQVTRATGSGDFVNQYTITNKTLTNLTVEFSGAAAQGTDAIVFGGLKINNASGITLSGNVTVNGTLRLADGIIITGPNQVIVSSIGTLLRTSGHVFGKLRKNVATGATSLTFEVGDASNYTPVSVSFASVTAAGDLTVNTTSVDHPNIAGSTIIPSKSVNRYWTLTNSGVVFTTYNAIFNFVPGDLDAGTDTNTLIAGKFASATWTYPAVGARTATSTEVTGLSTFSDFQLGQGGTPNVTLVKNVTPSGDQEPGTDLSYTVTFTNSGSIAAQSLVITDPDPGNIDLTKRGFTNVDYQLGSASISSPWTATITFSNDNGVTCAYTPLSGGGGAPPGYDRAVTNICWAVNGGVAVGASGVVSFTVRIR
jgi:hypothetical protein